MKECIYSKHLEDILYKVTYKDMHTLFLPNEMPRIHTRLTLDTHKSFTLFTQNLFTSPH